MTKLFEPIQIGNMTLKNRIALSPMATALLEEEGQPSKDAMEFYFRRAQGGPGLVMIQPGSILPEAQCIKIIRFDNDKYIEKMSQMAEGVKQRGAKVSFELVHHGLFLAQGGRALSPDNPDQFPVIGPSPLSPPGSDVVAQQMDENDIARIAEAFATAAGRVKKAGFDAVQIQLSNGFLLHQFRSLRYNHRDDKYGGSAENRARMACEVIAAVRKNVGPNFPIIARMSANDHSEDGVTLADSLVQAPLFVKAGANALDITGGSLETKDWIFSAHFMPPRLNLSDAAAIRKVVDVPVMVVGRMGEDPAEAEAAVRDGLVDIITLGRAMIADPDWPNKVRAGRVNDVRPCLACNECHRHTTSFGYMACSVNATAGKEIKYGTISATTARKRVLVVGGGPAGLESARIAAMRGHEVVLCERNPSLGGLMQLAGLHSARIGKFREWLVAEIKKLPIRVMLKTEVDVAIVEKLAPDVVVFAGGGSYATPDIDGMDRSNVFRSRDIMDMMNGTPVEKNKLLKIAGTFSPLIRRFANPTTARMALSSNLVVKKNIAVIGGGFSGCSLAISLADLGKNVVILEEGAVLGGELEQHVMMRLYKQAAAGKVRTLMETKVDAITAKGVSVSDSSGRSFTVIAGSVFVALDLAPSTSSLVDEIKDKAAEIHTVGDANHFGRIINAVGEGYRVAYGL